MAVRIAVAGLHIEATTFNPSRSRLEDFTVLRAEALLSAPQFGFLSRHDAQFVPILHARALPGPPMEGETYRRLLAETLERLSSALPVDGLYLALHGAAAVEGIDDAEAHYVGALRDLVGDDAPIAVSLDLHGNVSRALVDRIDIASAYRTAPHVDVERTMDKAVAMLLRCLEEGTRPGVAWCASPCVLPGEMTVTTASPGRELYRDLARHEADPGIWDASLMAGFVWADEPRVGASSLVTGTDRAAMTQAAAAIARDWFAARHDFAFGTPALTVDACLDAALSSATAPVFVSDSGDNVTAGGAGDRTDLLRALLEREAENCLVAGIADAPLVARLAGVAPGTSLTASIGGTLHPEGGPPLVIEMRLLHHTGDAALVVIAGVDIIVTARRQAFTGPGDFARFGIVPSDRRLVVVKLGYLFPDLAPLARPALMALSEGIVDQDVTRVPRHRVTRPLYPFDRNVAFEPRPVVSRRMRS